MQAYCFRFNFMFVTVIIFVKVVSTTVNVIESLKEAGYLNTFPKEVTIIVRSIAEPTFDVLVFCLAEQKTIPNAHRLSGSQQHQGVGWNHGYQYKTHTGTPFSL